MVHVGEGVHQVGTQGCIDVRNAELTIPMSVLRPVGEVTHTHMTGGWSNIGTGIIDVGTGTIGIGTGTICVGTGTIGVATGTIGVGTGTIGIGTGTVGVGTARSGYCDGLE